jgi:hypothetical protein
MKEGTLVGIAQGHAFFNLTDKIGMAKVCSAGSKTRLRCRSLEGARCDLADLPRGFLSQQSFALGDRRRPLLSLWSRLIQLLPPVQCAPHC